MNKENVLKVADAIETHSIKALGFDMRVWFGSVDDMHPPPVRHTCKTVACIGGWADAVRLEIKTAKNAKMKELSPVETTAAFLGLDDDEADSLFYLRDFHESWAKVTSSHAVAVLRHLAETGKVDWSIALPVQPVTEG